MIKKSDLFSELNKSKENIWKGNWENTVSDDFKGYSVKDLDAFLSPQSLSKYLPLKNKENFQQRASVLKNIFYALQKYIMYSKLSDDPSVLSLITKLVTINKLYNEIPDEFKKDILIFGGDIYGVSDKEFKASTYISIFGYDFFTYLATELNFSPNLIMQIARGMDIQDQTDLSGRDNLQYVLEQKYNVLSKTPLYSILSNTEYTLDYLCDEMHINDDNIYSIDGEKIHGIYPWVTNKFSYPSRKIRQSISANLDANEYGALISQTSLHTNTIIPDLLCYNSNIPPEYAISVLEQMSENGQIQLFLDNLNNPELQNVIRLYNSNENAEVIKLLNNRKYRNIQKIIQIYRLLILLLASKFKTTDQINNVKKLVGEDFSWVDLKQNPNIAINGLLTDQELHDFFTKNPKMAKMCKVDFPGKQEIIEIANQQSKNEIISKQNIYNEAIQQGTVTFYKGLKNVNTVFDLLMEESDKLGINKDEFDKYSEYIEIYIVDFKRWFLLCRSYELPANSFLNVDIQKIAAIWLPDGVDHNGQKAPIIIAKTNALEDNIVNLFDNLDISKSFLTQTLIAHEGGHALHYLSDPDMQDIEHVNEGDIGEYYGSIQENIAYAHGQLPYFYKIIINKIKRILTKPIVQNAIREWIFTNILSSEDAPLQGFYRSRDIMKQAMYLQQQFNVDIQEYIEKKKQRQIYKMLDMLYQDQQNNKMEILKDLIKQKKDIQKQIDEIIKKMGVGNSSTFDEIKKLKLKQQNIETKQQLVLKNKLVIDTDDAAEAITQGFIREYFLEQISRMKQHGLQAPTIPEIEEHTKFLMDATDLTGEGYRPLTSEILPFTTTQTDRSGGFYPHLEEQKPIEASILNKLVKIANKIDYYATDISDQIENITRRIKIC